MSKHDEDIRKAKKEIERLSAEIEKKKARIAELRENIKILEAKKAEDLKISDAVLAMLNENGVDSDAEREAVIRKMRSSFSGYSAAMVLSSHPCFSTANDCHTAGVFSDKR